MAVRNAVREIKTSIDWDCSESKHRSIEIAWLWSCVIMIGNHQNKNKIINQNSIPTNSYLNILKEIPWKNISQYLGYSHIDKPVDKCELNLTTGTSWILPRIPSTWREEKKNEEHFENLKLLKGPSRYWKTTYTNEFNNKNGKENIKYTFLDNSFYEIGANSEECSSLVFIAWPDVKCHIC